MTPTTEHPSIAAAFVAAQAEFTHVVATREGQARAAKFKFADLSDLIEMAKPILQAHGLGYRTVNGRAEGGVTAETVLIHAATGEEMSNGPTFIGVPDDGGGQAFGSAYTYARRYSFLAALGIAADDDDGTAAMAAQADKVERARAAAAAPKLSDEQVDCITRIMLMANHKPNLAGKLAEDYATHVDAAVAYVVKQKKLDVAFANEVTAAAMNLDAAKLSALLGDSEAAA